MFKILKLNDCLTINRKTDHNKSILFFVTLVSLLVGLDITAVNLLLVSMSNALQFPLYKGQWIINAYLLIYSAMLIASGRCGDVLGYKKCLLIGIVFFFVGSLFSACAGSFASMVIGRFIQGMGAALITPNGMAMLYHVYPENQHGFISGALSSILGAGMAFGPFLGGFLTQINSWRLLFIINLPLSAIVFFFMSTFMKEEFREGQKSIRDIDIVGSILFGIFLFSLLFLFDNFKFLEQHDWYIFFLILLLFLSSLIFVFQQKRALNPIIDIKLFSTPSLIGACTIRLLYGFPVMSFIYFLASYFQSVLHYGPIDAGIMFLPFTLALVFISPYVGKKLDKHGFSWSLIAGSIISIFSFLGISYIQISTVWYWVVALMLFSGIGVSLFRPGMLVATMKFTPKKQVGLMNSISSVLTNIGGAIGIAVTGSMIADNKNLASKDALSNALPKVMFLSIFLFLVILLIVLIELWWKRNRRLGE